MDLEKLAIKIQVDSDEAEKKTSRLTEGLGKLGKVALAGVGAMATAVGALGKSAIDGYADYEQLTGGVETLFGESANEVMKFAETAFKTTGQSANEYMETVTSFSASLLQSLGGDTEKTAQYADKAMTDMADNANKMGTSMESVENAYKGFAKQNYTMLDNLKLGYGGTKSEMERLLADATALSGVEYDISSYSDIIDAIHVVQDELGITGTTAKEASTTISGSISSMKASWQNLVTGLADPNANVGALISSFTESIVTVGSNILPVVQQVLLSVGTLITDMVPPILDMVPPLIMEILPSLLQSSIDILMAVITSISENLPMFINLVIDLAEMLAQSIAENAPTILAMVVEALVTIVNTVSERLPEFITMLINLIGDLATSLIENAPTLVSSLTEALGTLIQTIQSNLPTFLTNFVQLILSLVTAISQSLPSILGSLSSLLADLIVFILSNIPQFAKAGFDLFVGIIKDLPKIIAEIVKHIPEIILAILEGFGNIGKDMADVGLNLVKGLWNGINNAKSWITSKVKGWVGSVTSSIKSFFGIHSPSKVFAEMGDYLVQGLGVGIEDNAYKAVDSVEAMANAVQDAFNPELQTDDFIADGNFNSTFTAEGDYQSDLIGSLAVMCRQVLNAIEDKDFSIQIGDEVIANSANRGNQSYLRRTGKPLIV